jgi:acetyltransferase-like isoleucine patch superfamily enzyme
LHGCGQPVERHKAKTQLKSNSIIHDNVIFGEECLIEDFCTIGVPPQGHQAGGLPTTFGKRARISSHSVIYAGNEFGDDFAVGHGAYLRDGNQIGDRVEIGPLNVWEGKVTVASDVTIGAQTGIAEYTVIGNGVVIGHQVGIAGVLHPLTQMAKETGRGPAICDGVTIGTGSSILPGLRIGAGAYIEKGSVVVRDVRPFSVVAGNPAKQIGDVRELHPEALQHIRKYVDTSDGAVDAICREFDEVPTHFPPR